MSAALPKYHHRKYGQMGKTFYSILQGDEFKSVAGIQLTSHFAARVENGWGYRITHLPTGWLLTNIGFSSIELATQFAKLFEDAFEPFLDQSDVRILRDKAKTSPLRQNIYQLKHELDNLALTKKTVVQADLDEIVRKITNGQQTGTDS